MTPPVESYLSFCIQYSSFCFYYFFWLVRGLSDLYFIYQTFITFIPNKSDVYLQWPWLSLIKNTLKRKTNDCKCCLNGFNSNYKSIKSADLKYPLLSPWFSIKCNAVLFPASYKVVKSNYIYIKNLFKEWYQSRLKHVDVTDFHL